MKQTKTSHKAPGKHSREGLTILQLFDKFPDDASAERWFEGQRWSNGRCCPDCGSLNSVAITSRKPMPYRCRDCRQYFSVRKGMVFQSSKIGLRKWAIAIYMMSTSLKGVSSMKLHRELGVTQTTAWYMLQRIREGFFNDPSSMSGPIEVDETYFGGKRKNMPKSKRAKLEGRGPVGKTAVVGAKDRKTKKVSARVVEDTKAETLLGFIRNTAVPGAEVFTDDATVYENLAGYIHESVNHSGKEYVRGDVHTNGIESLWSMLKRGYIGTYHKMSPKHLHRYLKEFTGRQNVRELGTLEQMKRVVLGMDGKRLRYKDLVG